MAVTSLQDRLRNQLLYDFHGPFKNLGFNLSAVSVEIEKRADEETAALCKLWEKNPSLVFERENEQKWLNKIREMLAQADEPEIRAILVANKA